MRTAVGEIAVAKLIGRLAGVTNFTEPELYTAVNRAEYGYAGAIQERHDSLEDNPRPTGVIADLPVMAEVLASMLKTSTPQTSDLNMVALIKALMKPAEKLGGLVDAAALAYRGEALPSRPL